MTKITVNEKPIENEINNNATINDVIELILSNNNNKTSVTSIKVNNQLVENEDNAFLNSTVGKYDSVDLIVRPKIDLAFEAINSSNRYIDYIISKIHDLAESYNKNKTKEANEIFAQVIEIMSLFIQLMSNTYSILQEHYPDKNVKEKEVQFLELHMLGILKALVPAREKNDIIMLSDLLEHELVDNLKQWQKQIIPKLVKLKKEKEALQQKQSTHHNI